MHQRFLHAWLCTSKGTIRHYCKEGTPKRQHLPGVCNCLRQVADDWLAVLTLPTGPGRQCRHLVIPAIPSFSIHARQNERFSTSLRKRSRRIWLTHSALCPQRNTSSLAYGIVKPHEDAEARKSAGCLPHSLKRGFTNISNSHPARTVFMRESFVPCRLGIPALLRIASSPCTGHVLPKPDCVEALCCTTLQDSGWQSRELHLKPLSSPLMALFELITCILFSNSN